MTAVGFPGWCQCLSSFQCFDMTVLVESSNRKSSPGCKKTAPIIPKIIIWRLGHPGVILEKDDKLSDH